MATAYANPVPAPAWTDADGTFDNVGYEKRCAQYRADTLAYIKTKLGGKGKHVGKVISFPVADGYAEYMVWTLSKWIHLDEYDGYSAYPATIRGTRTTDVVAMIERQDSLRELFAGKA
jgi:hypothetical protein